MNEEFMGWAELTRDFRDNRFSGIYEEYSSIHCNIMTS